jgi:hypothetical protein
MAEQTNNTDDLSRPPQNVPSSSSSSSLEDQKSRFYFYQESTSAKLWRLCKTNPFAPIGLCAVVASFVGGMLTIKNPNATYRFMQARVYTQGFTVASLLIGQDVWSAITMPFQNNPQDNENQ